MSWNRRLPAIRGKAYFASCSQGPLSQDVMKAIKRYEDSILRWGNPWDEWMEEVYKASDIFADIVGAGRDEVCPHYSASSALISLLSAFKPDKRDKIVTTDLDYPTVGVTLAGMKRMGFDVVTLRSREGCIGLEQYEEAVDERTLMVAVFHVSALNGFRQDIKAISEICRRKGAYLLVDAYQSVGAVPIDVDRMGIDFLVAGTTKFLLGIPGAGFLYARREHAEGLEPTAVSWFSQKDPFLFGREEMDFRDGAKRFEMGTWSVVSMYAAAAGMSIIKSLGVTSIWEKIIRSRDYLRDRLVEEGFELYSPPDQTLGPTISLYVGEKAHRLEAYLKRRRVIASARGPGLRFAHHFFNTRDDCERAVEALSRAVKRLP
ncbi:Cysteine desulfurase IscS [archaeon HR01]|nr:Cysteine desulfurase IscS [archaeon HR01]